MYEAISAEYMESAKEGFDSTKGLGERGPDPSDVKTTFDGVIVPDSKPINYPQRTKQDEMGRTVEVPFHLRWNEYIIYNEARARLKYLVMLQ